VWLSRGLATATLVGSSVVQEEVVRVTDELLAFGNDWAGLSGSAEGKGAGALRVVVVS